MDQQPQAAALGYAPREEGKIVEGIFLRLPHGYRWVAPQRLAGAGAHGRPVSDTDPPVGKIS